MDFSVVSISPIFPTPAARPPWSDALINRRALSEPGELARLPERCVRPI